MESNCGRLLNSVSSELGKSTLDLKLQHGSGCIKLLVNPKDNPRGVWPEELIESREFRRSKDEENIHCTPKAIPRVLTQNKITKK